MLSAPFDNVITFYVTLSYHIFCRCQAFLFVRHNGQARAHTRGRARWRRSVGHGQALAAPGGRRWRGVGQTTRFRVGAALVSGHGCGLVPVDVNGGFCLVAVDGWKTGLLKRPMARFSALVDAVA